MSKRKQYSIYFKSNIIKEVDGFTEQSRII